MKLPPDLTQMLSHPIGRGQIIAIVKGSIHPDIAPDIERVPDEEAAVDYFDVTHSYGLIIPPGRYILSVSNTWGMGCIYYAQRPKLHDSGDVKDPVYLAISRVHGRTLVVPQGVEHGLLLDRYEVVYRRDEALLKSISLNSFSGMY